jgi:hypothetical protein
MIFRSVPDPTIHRHRTPQAESKRFLEVTDIREPPGNAVGRHAVVVQLWWTQRVPDGLLGRYSLLFTLLSNFLARWRVNVLRDETKFESRFAAWHLHTDSSRKVGE